MRHAIEKCLTKNVTAAMVVLRKLESRPMASLERAA
jgi:hypothetical protein